MESHPQMVIKRKEQEAKLFLQDLGQLFQGEQFCDVRIRCCDGDLACQSVLLSAVSPFLRHIFSTRSIIEEESHLLLIVPNTRCLEVEIFLSALLGLNGQSTSDICDSPEFKNVSETFEAFMPLKPQFKEPLSLRREKSAGNVFPTENWCQVSIKSENGEHDTNVDTKDINKLSDVDYDDDGSSEEDDGSDVEADFNIDPKQESLDPNDPPRIIGINKRKPGRPKKGEVREKTIDDEAYIEIIPGSDGKNNSSVRNVELSLNANGV
eukprot:TRINITY_DN16147_c0_g1_i1.p1 TRINITY_DN16147_c0_g1~~TRINITY_DN16147_c0_g1_i1.p1  ORF type:complete len:266 (+),score=46.87 TRINITY_DN16147_c0_g1_i1:208-1005(+)